MKAFHCTYCARTVYFENSRCLNCGYTLAHLPDQGLMGALAPTGEGLWRSPSLDADARSYRLCANYLGRGACNWAVPAGDPNSLCLSCRLTENIADLKNPVHAEACRKLEAAKRRLVYNLMNLGLSFPCKREDPESGLAFQFLADPEDPAAPRVLTGHLNGLITINMAEADDAERERRRLQMREPYRTLLGHLRHEVGHYYWDRLVRDGDRLDGFRALFGDERQDYCAALRCHYSRGGSDAWQEDFISAYASAHPWEDWAETWAHYLHMTDTLETASASGVALRHTRGNVLPIEAGRRQEPFDRMLDRWFPLTCVLNNLSRGLGLADSYPFVLTPPVLDKLRFIHDTIGRAVRSRTSRKKRSCQVSKRPHARFAAAAVPAG